MRNTQLKKTTQIIGFIALTLIFSGCSFGSSDKQSASELLVNTNGLNVQNTNTGNGTIATGSIDLEYPITQCEEASWVSELAAAENPEGVVSAWLAEYTIVPEAINIEEPPVDAMYCQACGCPTGTVVQITVPASQQDAAEALGFATPDVVVSIQDQAVDVSNEEVTKADEAVLATQANTETEVNDEAEQDITEDAEVADQAARDYDADLTVRAEVVESDIRAYFERNGYYPENLDALQSSTDTSGIYYTPIGVLPAEYYDLVIDFTSGQEIRNP